MPELTAEVLDSDDEEQDDEALHLAFAQAFGSAGNGTVVSRKEELLEEEDDHLAGKPSEIDTATAVAQTNEASDTTVDSAAAADQDSDDDDDGALFQEDVRPMDVSSFVHGKLSAQLTERKPDLVQRLQPAESKQPTGAARQEDAIETSRKPAPPGPRVEAHAAAPAEAEAEANNIFDDEWAEKAPSRPRITEQMRPQEPRPPNGAAAAKGREGPAAPAAEQQQSGPGAEEDSAHSAPPGFVMLCNNATEMEAKYKSLFGAPRHTLHKMRTSINPNTLLFLLNRESHILYGFFAAEEEPSMDIDQDAFGGRFGAQVRVRPWSKEIRWLPIEAVGKVPAPGPQPPRFVEEMDTLYLQQGQTADGWFSADQTSSSTAPPPAQAMDVTEGGGGTSLEVPEPSGTAETAAPGPAKKRKARQRKPRQGGPQGRRRAKAGAEAELDAEDGHEGAEEEEPHAEDAQQLQQGPQVGPAASAVLPAQEEEEKWAMAAKQALTGKGAGRGGKAAVANDDMSALAAQTRLPLRRKSAENGQQLGEPLGKRMRVPGATARVTEISSASEGESEHRATASSVTVRRAAPSAAFALDKNEALQSWSLCMLERALLVSRKRRAVAAEDFATALRSKELEEAVLTRLRHACEEFRKAEARLSRPPAVAAQLEKLQRQKEKAIQAEDYELAEKLKQQQLKLQQSQPSAAATNEASVSRKEATALQKELEEVLQLKAEASINEDFRLAAELKDQQQQLERKLEQMNPGGMAAERQAVDGALRLLEDAGKEAVLLACDQSIAELCEGQPERLWGDAVDEVRRWLCTRSLASASAQ